MLVKILRVKDDKNNSHKKYITNIVFNKYKGIVMFETTWIPQKTFDEMAACARHHG
jgi:hypothetical protein